jgi:hypothetical protein
MASPYHFIGQNPHKYEYSDGTKRISSLSVDIKELLILKKMLHNYKKVLRIGYSGEQEIKIIFRKAMSFQKRKLKE